MKNDTHLKMNPVIFRDTEAEVDFVSKSTMTSKEVEKIDGVDHYLIKIEISSASHPFYTGTERILDTAGRVEKFKSRIEKAKGSK